MSVKKAFVTYTTLGMPVLMLDLMTELEKQHPVRYDNF